MGPKIACVRWSSLSIRQHQGTQKGKSRTEFEDQMARVATGCAAIFPQRRGLSAAITVVEEGSAKKVAEKAVKLGTVAKNVASALATTTEEKTAFWEPDPETGFYRPVTGTKEVDAADLRAEMLKQRILQEIDGEATKL